MIHGKPLQMVAQDHSSGQKIFIGGLYLHLLSKLYFFMVKTYFGLKKTDLPISFSSKVYCNAICA